ncbi:VOC family protein [Fulvivirgaceae bacterium PWU5]|uniref:VOC family protein n=1 Tax=Dawidia cretensis TaxID=2782350 RepID=A0AAP2E3E3_9BACT|nr:VOC family protein [Dawidia cretensis]MBT1712341.1 VOC family protein [Dawidia cretensis]
MSTVATNQKIIPFLWFNGKAEEAMKLYTSLFANSKIESLKKWDAGSGFDGVMVGTIVLDGLRINMFDAGPHFTFNESFSFFVTCKDQAEVDMYWNALTRDGGAESQCGWLKDKFGFSWQIVPAFMIDKINNGEPKRLGQLMQVMMKMQKLIVADLEAAYNK